MSLALARLQKYTRPGGHIAVPNAFRASSITELISELFDIRRSAGVTMGA